MSGYQEILSDPSYAQQIITFTYPHIGNTGTNNEDNESEKVWASGMVIRDLPMLESNFRSEQSLSDFLVQQNVLAISDIDTRRLTRILREHGPLNGCIIAGSELKKDMDKTRAEALAAAKKFPGLVGMDLAKEVTCADVYPWQEGSWDLIKGHQIPDQPGEYHVVAYDFGIKRNILRMLTDRSCRVTVVPAETPATEVLALEPDGVFLSNGPGDPEPCDYAINAISEILETGIPVFGICLGHQLLALASGAKTVKMKLGHHGANHPVQELESERVFITSQNHGFAVDEESLPDNVKVTYKSLFDESLQGIHLTDKPAFGFQGHPEASPGPHDIAPVFDHFIDLITARN
jgi:carbamoyl-phosphate synthase small subunit